MAYSAAITRSRLGDAEYEIRIVETDVGPSDSAAIPMPFSHGRILLVRSVATPGGGAATQLVPVLAGNSDFDEVDREFDQYEPDPDDPLRVHAERSSLWTFRADASQELHWKSGVDDTCDTVTTVIRVRRGWALDVE
jgi:hypothetical protein